MPRREDNATVVRAGSGQIHEPVQYVEVGGMQLTRTEALRRGIIGDERGQGFNTHGAGGILNKIT